MLAASLLLAVALLPQQDAEIQRAARPAAAELARSARAATYRYESRLWRLVPTTMGGGRGDRCDEVVGRFCLWYGTGETTPVPPPAEEPEEVEEARVVAVRAHRLWFSAAPEDSRAARALVRYLLEDRREGEAVAAARAHVWAAGGTAGSLMVLGLALHHAADFEAAEAAFDSARAVADPDSRNHWDDLTPLLEPDERRHYRGLSPAEREAYARRFWAFSDPSLIQPGNERRSGHYARHAWAAIYSETPRVRGKVSWGPDLEELLVRYGPVSHRRRIREMGPGSWMLDRDPRYQEHYPEHAVALVPAAMVTAGITWDTVPGVRPELERDSARSAYAAVRPGGPRRIVPMRAQVSWFPGPAGSVLRVDGVLVGDSAAPVPVAPRARAAVLDTLGVVLATAEPALGIRGDSVFTTVEVPVPAGPVVVLLEVQDDSTGTGGRFLAARRIPAASGLSLSDLVVAGPFGDSLPRARGDAALAPSPALLMDRGARVGLYAEAHGLSRRNGNARYAVEWSVESAEDPSLVGRAFRWVGERLGLVSAEQPMTIRWDDVTSAGTAPIALNLELGDLEAGLYRVTLTLTDRQTDAQRRTSRLLRIRDARAASPGPAGR